MIDLKELQDFCLNKNVLLVGNNDTIIKNDNGELIDSYDVVVRMNHAIPQKNIGFKTDLWLCSFNSVPKQKQEYPLFKPKYVIRLNENEFIHDDIKDNLYIWPTVEHSKFKEQLGSLPSTGCMAIYFFLEYVKTLKSLTLIGYDFFETKSYYNSQKIAHKWHDINNEKEFAQEMLKLEKIKMI